MRFLRIFLHFVVYAYLTGGALAYWQTRDSTYNNPIVSGGPACSPVACLGDVVSGATLYYSTSYCYNAAYTGKVMDVNDVSTGISATTFTCAANGVINQSGTALAETCAVSCSIRNLYNRSHIRRLVLRVRSLVY